MTAKTHPLFAVMLNSNDSFTILYFVKISFTKLSGKSISYNCYDDLN